MNESISYTVNPISCPEEYKEEFEGEMQCIVLERHYFDLRHLHRAIQHFPAGTVFELKIHKKSA